MRTTENAIVQKWEICRFEFLLVSFKLSAHHMWLPDYNKFKYLNIGTKILNPKYDW